MPFKGGKPLKYKDKRTLTKIEDFRQLLLSTAERFGDKALYASPDPKHDFRYSYNDLKNNSLWLAAAFLHRYPNGARVAVIGEANPAYMTTFYAVTIAGGVIIPIDKELSPDAIAGFLDRARADGIVYMPSMNGTVEPLCGTLKHTELFVPVEAGEGSPQDAVLYSALVSEGKELFESGEKEVLTRRLDMQSMCTLLFTSGTTGTSKGVMLSMNNIVSCANSCCESVIYDENNIFLSVLPMNHVYELVTENIALVNLGATTYLNNSLKYVSRNIKKVAPDSLILVPLFLETMHKSIFRSIEKRGMTAKVNAARKLSRALLKCGIDIRRKLFAEIINELGGNLRYIICGGAALRADIVRDFEDFGIMICEGYGITECAPLLAVNRPFECVPGSAGRAVSCCEVRIDEPDGDGIGEIVAKGENVMLGYYEDSEATAKVFTDDGWFKTGDIGYIDTDGNIFITGRKKNLIILSNGKNIYPEEIEEHLLTSDYICECVVIERSGEITALIYPDKEKTDGMSDDDIYKLIKEEVDRVSRDLPVFKQVHSIEIRKTEFEKTTTKKIKRYILK